MTRPCADDASAARLTSDVEYWRALNPRCTISDFPWRQSRADYPIPASEMSRCVSDLRHQGYFQTRPIVPRAELGVLADCIRTVAAHGHRTTYALLYDEFYQVLERLGAVLRPVLGPDYQLVADEFETYLIPTTDEASGSPPHRDALRNALSLAPDGTPNLVNVWLPLTDATTLNSCIHVLPAHLDNNFRASGAQRGAPKKEMVPLQDIRALPAPAGSVLCWSTHLLHWGGRSSRLAPEPRLSFAAYFQSRRCPAFHPATMDIPSELPFDYRLYLVEKVWKDPACRRIEEYKPRRAVAGPAPRAARPEPSAARART